MSSQIHQQQPMSYIDAPYCNNLLHYDQLCDMSSANILTDCTLTYSTHFKDNVSTKAVETKNRTKGKHIRIYDNFSVLAANYDFTHAAIFLICVSL